MCFRLQNYNGSVARDAVSCRKPTRVAPEGQWVAGFDGKGRPISRAVGYMVNVLLFKLTSPSLFNRGCRVTGPLRHQLRLPLALPVRAPAPRHALHVPEELPPLRLLRDNRGRELLQADGERRPLRPGPAGVRHHRRVGRMRGAPTKDSNCQPPLASTTCAHSLQAVCLVCCHRTRTTITNRAASSRPCTRP